MYMFFKFLKSPFMTIKKFYENKITYMSNTLLKQHEKLKVKSISRSFSSLSQ